MIGATPCNYGTSENARLEAETGASEMLIFWAPVKAIEPEEPNIGADRFSQRAKGDVR